MPDSSLDAPVSLIKRLLVILYDVLLLLAVFLIVGIPLSTLTTFLLNDGNAITPDHPYYLLNQIIVLSALLLSSLLFYGWFWTHGGQTLGMKTWRIQLVSENGGAINWRQAVIRYFAAILSWLLAGVGFLWVLADGQNRSWHDILSRSFLRQLPKDT